MRIIVVGFTLAFFLSFGSLPGCLAGENKSSDEITAGLAARLPQQWGERVYGVKTRLATTEKRIALTLDACGGARGRGFDGELIDFLKKEKIPAALFISGLWLKDNAATLARLAREPLFTIENHGTNHRPCSVSGRAAYGIAGTRNVEEAFEEIEQNARKIQELTGRRPKFYRPGTAHLDEVCVEIAESLAQKVVNYSLPGDGGATWPRRKVKKALLAATPGAILLLHMNHPQSGTAAGLKDAYPELSRRGWRFVRLADYDLK